MRQKVRVKKSVVINQPIAEVFEYVSNFSRTRIWSGAVLASQPVETEATQPGVGYCYKNLVKFLDRQLELTYQIIEYQPNLLITAKTIAGLLPSLVCYNSDPLAVGTLLTYQQEIGLIGLFKPFEAIIYKSLDRQAEQDLTTLKDWLESRLYSLL